MSYYLVTVLGSNQTKQIMADNPQTAIEIAFGTKDGIGIQYIDTKNTPNPQYNVRVELLGGKKKSVNYYLVDFKQIADANTKNNKAQTRQTIAELFKAEVKKEKNRQVTMLETKSQSDIENFVAARSLKTVYKNLVKEGKTGAELNRAIARENFKKNSTGYEEMLMQAENLSDNYEIVDIKNYQTVLQALNTYPCMILARKSGGGVTGFFGTTNLAIMEKIYGKCEPNLYAHLKLTGIYDDFLKITDRKIKDIKEGREYNPPKPEHRVYQIASCQLRLKEETKYNRSTKVYDPTGRLEVSSTNYGVVLENLLCVVAYKDVAPVDKTLIETLGKGAISMSDEDFNAKFKFSRTAFGLAMQTIKEGNLPSSFEKVFKSEIDRQGISSEDANIYWQAKQVSLAKKIVGVIDEVKAGVTTNAVE